MQYLVLAGGLMFFMCLFGYYQELVIVYSRFKRKLSLFSTFLHFLGCSFFAQLQYHYDRKRYRPRTPIHQVRTQLLVAV